MAEEKEKPTEPEVVVETEVKVTNLTDYKGKSEKNKGTGGPTAEKAKVEKVVTGEVVVQKKRFFRRAKEGVIAADFQSVGDYLLWDWFVPLVKRGIVEGVTNGIERAIFGDKAIRTRNNITGNRESRVTLYPYNQHSNPLSRNAIDVNARSIERRSADRERYILSSREDADRVLDEMTEIIDTQGFVTVATLKELIGFQSVHVDYKWGWKSLMGVTSRQVSEGWLIDFPSPTQV